MTKKICQYCRMTIDTSERCPLCKKSFCVYHVKAEEHHCDKVDWKGMKKAKYAETEARFKRVNDRVSIERTMKSIMTAFAWLIILASIAFILYPSIKDLDISGMLSFNSTKSQPDEDRIADLVFQYTNDKRVGHNMSRLENDPLLEEAADWMSECLSLNNILAHESAQCNTLEERYQQFGVSYLSGGENIALDWDAQVYYSASDKPVVYSTDEEIARYIVEGWMDSPSHRENILDDSFTRIGIGIYYNRTSHKIITTQNFAG